MKLYAVSAYNIEGYESARSHSVAFYMDDFIPPSIPTNLHSTLVSADSISIAWNGSEDNIGVSAYLVYRNGLLFESISGLTYVDHEVEEGEDYVYRISALDDAGNESELSESFTVA